MDKNKLALDLWGPRETQDKLISYIEQHNHILRERSDTPRGGKQFETFQKRARQLLERQFIDGRKLYDLLIDTDGTELALAIYRQYHGLPGWRDDDGFPDIVDAADELENPPPLSAELIHGILRKGHQLLISGGSKTSKSFLALELALSVALGDAWLDTYDCAQGRVLYIDGELDRPSFDRRIMAILDAKRIDRADLAGRLDIMTARGAEVTAAQLADKIKQNGKNYDLIIIDPLYTMGDVKDENNAAEVRGMLKEIGTLATETGAALAEIHHHSKGAQGGKRSIDRASGSGVFGRWFDAILDLSVLNVPDNVAEQSKTPDSVGMRIEADLRDFKNPKPLSLWWHYPLHIPDVSGELDGCFVEGDTRANLNQYSDGTSAAQKQKNRDAELVRAVNSILAAGNKPTVKAIQEELGISDKSVRNWIKDSDSVEKDGTIIKIVTR